MWTQFVTAFLLLLAFPALQGAAILQGMNRLAGTSIQTQAEYEAWLATEAALLAGQ